MKLIISKKCIEKIHTWNLYDNGKEISGTAVYEVKESLPNGFPKVVELTNFIILDMGTGATTAFSGEKMAHAVYAMRNDLNDHSFIGIIHSHVEMNVFFSATDETQLSDSTTEIGFLISTIFNHKMKIASKISYKDQYGIIAKQSVKVELEKMDIPPYLLEEINLVTKEFTDKETLKSLTNNRLSNYNNNTKQLSCFSKKDYPEYFPQPINETPEVYETDEDNQLIQYYMNQIVERYPELETMEEYFNTQEMEKYKKLCPEYQKNVLALLVLFEEGTIDGAKLEEMNKLYGN